MHPRAVIVCVGQGSRDVEHPSHGAGRGGHGQQLQLWWRIDIAHQHQEFSRVRDAPILFAGHSKGVAQCVAVRIWNGALNTNEMELFQKRWNNALEYGEGRPLLPRRVEPLDRGLIDLRRYLNG